MVRVEIIALMLTVETVVTEEIIEMFTVVTIMLVHNKVFYSLVIKKYFATIAIILSMGRI